MCEYLLLGITQLSKAGRERQGRQAAGFSFMFDGDDRGCCRKPR